MVRPLVYWDKDNELYKYDCPNCRKQLAKRGENTKISKMYKPNFCSNCGTEIEWVEMNRHQRSLNLIEEIVRRINHNGITEFTNEENILVKGALDDYTELVNLVTPKKPKDILESSHYPVLCPRCGKMTIRSEENGFQLNACYNCGQFIDWNDNEDG